MAGWTYGKEGEAFPVQVGDTWRVGRHYFICSDLMADDLLTRTVGTLTAVPTLLYCDPPWNQGNVNSFRTKAGLAKADHTFLSLYRRITQLATTWNVPAYIEGGNNERASVQALLPYPHKATWPIVYYRKHPCTLHYTGPSPSPVSGIEGLDDELTPGRVMSAHGPAGIVLDPCAGRGVTSRQAHRSGWTSINNELHPRRMSAALIRAAKLTGATPERVTG